MSKKYSKPLAEIIKICAPPLAANFSPPPVGSTTVTKEKGTQRWKASAK